MHWGLVKHCLKASVVVSRGPFAVKCEQRCCPVGPFNMRCHQLPLARNIALSAALGARHPGTPLTAVTCPTSTASHHELYLHKPVMVKEIVQHLSPKPGQVFLDMTFGAGGHTKAILSQAPDISVFALDRDPVAYGIAQQVSETYHGRIQPLLGRFSQLADLLAASGVEADTFDGIVLDAGCSSMQFDTPCRGFALSQDGPLDMRMDGNRYPDMPSAADVVNALDQHSLASILRIYGEERHAKKIAAAVVQARSIYPITRTQQLAGIVAGAFPGAATYARKDQLHRSTHVATKTFQALRIFVNDELNELLQGLKAADTFLKARGCLVALTFHSLEDRVVKRFLHNIDFSESPNLSARQKIRQGLRKEKDNVGTCLPQMKALGWSSIQKKVLTPDSEEIQENPRGRSAKLRAAIKL